MNAPIAPAAVQTSALAIASITPSRTHIQEMRRLRFTAKETQELADSIKHLGVVQAVVVRPDPQGKTEYELVAGERRLVAAKLAGLTHIPATLREFTDDQVLEVQLVENLQRSDLHELEEAEGYDELMKLKKISKDQIGDMIGKSRAYVYARLTLLKLDLDGRKAFYAGELDASRALYIARIANPALRAKALQLALETNYYGERLSVRDLRKQLSSEEFSIHLSLAPFALDDPSFFEEVTIKKGVKEPRALPTCQACPSYTGNCIDLFSQGDDPNVCMEPTCFKIKVRQHSDRLRQQATNEGAPIIAGDEAKKIFPGKGQQVGYIDLDETFDDDEPELPELKMKDFKSDEDYDKAEAAQERIREDYKPRTFRQVLEGEAVTTVLVEDPKTKTIRTMVPVEEAKKAIVKKGLNLYDYKYKPKQEYKPPAVSEAMKREQAEQQARRDQEKLFRLTVLKAVFAKWSGPLKEAELRALADRYLDDYLDDGYGYDENPLVALYGKTPDHKTMKEADLVKLCAILTVADCVDEYGSPKALLELAKRLKVDTDKIKKELKAAAKAPAKPAAAKAPKKAK